MTAAKKRRRKKRMVRRIKCIMAWVILIATEAAIAAVPAGAVALVALPVANASRGIYEVGLEWVLIAAVFYATFRLVHEMVCRKIFEGE